MVRPEIKKARRQQAESVINGRKERKRLLKVILRKRHNVDRTALLKKLKQYQLDPEHARHLHATTSMQTQGLKRFVIQGNDGVNGTRLDERAECCSNASRLIRTKRRKLRLRNSVKSSDHSSSEDTDDISIESDSNLQEVPTDKVESDQPYHGDSKQLLCVGASSGLNQSMKLDVTAKDINDQAAIVPAISLADNQPPPLETRPQPATYVEVKREPDIENQRSKLPIIGEEQSIMEAIYYNDIVIISGETGSGKTTQLPQFLYESGYALNKKLIGITEPRRVAAIAMSERVAHEMSLSASEVSYQIRFSGNVTEDTKIKFMTDGVLLKECQRDFLLSRYSAIIIDEAHERSVFSDILIGLLSRIVPLRSKKGDPLKLIIMSATLRLSDFAENKHLFLAPPPIIKVDSRQFPVKIKFAKRTPENFLDATYKKVCAIHNRMPKGGILAFVTSQMDVKILLRKLTRKTDLHVLGLYAMLPLEKQRRVFEAPPVGSRLCVIATNVAETSITIPNIRYVVDSGMVKQKYYNPTTGVSNFTTTWTSKSSAEQRAGRAGRIGPGICYRLYSSAVFTNDFPDHTEPQILMKPVEDVLLQMKNMNIDNVVNFPFPTRPSLTALKSAEKKLVLLGALDDSKYREARYDEIDETEFTSKPTSLGRAMHKFSVGARCAKMLALAPSSILSHIIALVSALTVREMFITENSAKIRRKWAGHGFTLLLGDFIVMLRAVIRSVTTKCNPKRCESYGLRPKAMLEIDKLRRLLSNDVNKTMKDVRVDPEKKIEKPSLSQCKLMRQLLYSSFRDHVAKRIHKTTQQDNRKLHKNAYECSESDEPVYISQDSVLRGKDYEYLVYRELYKKGCKTYMRDLVVIDPEWLSDKSEL